MPPRLPPLNPLRAVEATARTGSIAGAARELNVTQGAISHQIRSLEATLDLALFEKRGRRLHPTAQAAPFLASVTEAFDTIAGATAQLGRPETRGALRIACVPALLSFWLLPRIAGFADAFPDVELTLFGSNDPAEIHGPDADLCILYGDGTWPDAWVTLWSKLDLFPVVSPLLLNASPLRSVRDLEGHTLVHADSGREWQSWLVAAGAELPFRARQHSLTDASLALQAASHGFGVALGDTLTVADFLTRGTLIIPFDKAIPARDSFFFACRPEVQKTPLVRAFIDWMTAELEAANARAEPQRAGRASIRRRAAGRRNGD
ncbi:LysR substrate-binding domain-containing protein [Acidimangrovimonas pyrenivorans]|uniref:LysR substrate-binding domain-containing protein n=1 Tax=Acidimangrovimonas pyrenivorans TaxID=2030798 RepID=A0ABV7ALI9_9RHOB